MFERVNRAAAIAIKHAMIAVVQEDDIASPCLAQAVNHPFRALCIPIPRHRGPHYNPRASALLNHGVQLGAAKTEGWAHPPAAPSDGGSDGIVATVELAGDTSRRQKSE
jgi:hypothetical protein